MGILMRELHLLDTGEASPANLCNVGLLAWWLQLQATCKTMSSVLHQLPLCIDFSYFTMHAGDPAWQLLLRCKYPIATLRCACLLLECRRVLCWGWARCHTG